MLVITLTSGESPKNVTKADIEKIIRTGRQFYDQTYPNDNEVVVDIQDDEKKQYYETNYDTS